MIAIEFPVSKNSMLYVRKAWPIRPRARIQKTGHSQTFQVKNLNQKKMLIIAC